MFRKYFFSFDPEFQLSIVLLILSTTLFSWSLINTHDKEWTSSKATTLAFDLIDKVEWKLSDRKASMRYQTKFETYYTVMSRFCGLFQLPLKQCTECQPHTQSEYTKSTPPCKTIKLNFLGNQDFLKILFCCKIDQFQSFFRFDMPPRIFRVTATLPGSVAKVAAILRDINNTSEWNKALQVSISKIWPYFGIGH